jgi:hypothetical protein
MVIAMRDVNDSIESIEETLVKILSFEVKDYFIETSVDDE